MTGSPLKKTKTLLADDDMLWSPTSLPTTPRVDDDDDEPIQILDPPTVAARVMSFLSVQSLILLSMTCSSMKVLFEFEVQLRKERFAALRDAIEDLTSAGTVVSRETYEEARALAEEAGDLIDWGGRDLRSVHLQATVTDPCTGASMVEIWQACFWHESKLYAPMDFEDCRSCLLLHGLFYASRRKPYTGPEPDEETIRFMHTRQMARVWSLYESWLTDNDLEHLDFCASVRNPLAPFTSHPKKNDLEYALQHHFQNHILFWREVEAFRIACRRHARANPHESPIFLYALVAIEQLVQAGHEFYETPRRRESDDSLAFL